jgi:hypothetical protein
MSRLIFRGGLLAIAILALSGSALAAQHYLITESSQIKPHTISASQLSTASHGYSTGFQTDVPLEQTGTLHTLMSLTVPTGSYVVNARLQGVTATDPDGPLGSDYRYDCYLRTPNAFLDASLFPRVGRTPGVESYLVYMGAFTGAGPITFSCLAGNGHPLIALTGRMTAIRVDGLN